MPLILAVLIVALAAHRAARLIAVDDISDPLRDWLHDRAYSWAPLPPLPEGARDAMDAELAGVDMTHPGEVLKSRLWGYLYNGLSCMHCVGVYLSVGLWALWVNVDGSHAIVAAAAVCGAQSALAARAT